MASAATARRAAPARGAAASPAPRRSRPAPRGRKPARPPKPRAGARTAPRNGSSRTLPGHARERTPSAARIPRAVGRTAVAVRALPDSGLVVRMTRGRAWIGVLSLLLAGIVALNVVNLSLSASRGRLGQQAQIIEQENSALRARLAERLSDHRIRNAAAMLGMSAPGPEDIRYRDASGNAVRALFTE